MTDRFRLTIAQLNPTVGDLPGNAAKAREAWAAAKAAGSRMLALPEMFITGYQTQDLVRKQAFTDQAMEAVHDLAAACADGPAIGIGGPWQEDDALHNAYLILRGGRVAATVFKHILPHTQPFDEVRLFDSGPIAGPYSIGGVRLGSPICEDAWWPEVAETLAETGAEILLVPNGSPYHRDKLDLRVTHMVARVIETGLPLVYLNSVGGQDDQVYDGASFVLNPGGPKVVQLPPFEEGLAHLDFIRTPEGWRCAPGAMAPQPDAWEQDYRAMMAGLGDYVRKSGFSRAVLGLSGGIDSALVAAIAVDALGAQNVCGVTLPSDDTPAASLEDAREVAKRLGICLDTVPVEAPHAAVAEALSGAMAGAGPGRTEENIRSRLRGLMLMAISDRLGALLLATGSKSEIALGHATVCGDLCGGYNPVKDLYKTRVFATCRWRNANHRPWMAGPAGEVIPTRVIEKPPGDERRPGRRDGDSLPPYDVLDAILEGLVEKDLGLRDLIAQGFDPKTVQTVERLLQGSEWKRSRAAPGPRLSARAFGLDRRYPLVNRWRDRV